MENEKLFNIYQRRNAVMKACSYVKKRKGGMPYSAAAADDVIAKLNPACIEHGVDLHPVDMETCMNGQTVSCKFNIRITNIDDPTDFILVPTFGQGYDKQDAGKACGKAYTYAYKYGLLKGFNLETGDQDDIDMCEPIVKETPKAAEKPSHVTQRTMAMYEGTAEQKPMLGKIFKEQNITDKDLMTIINKAVISWKLEATYDFLSTAVAQASIEYKDTGKISETPF